MLAGQTRSEAAKAIEAALSSYYSNLSAQVTVTKYTANRVLLLGAVAHPGMITFDGTPTLLEALSRGGIETGTNRNRNNARQGLADSRALRNLSRPGPGGVGGIEVSD